MSKAINNLFWHDGNLGDFTFILDKKGKSNLQLTVFIYKNEQAQSRDIYQIKCEGVLEFNSIIDTIELRRNVRAGNINQAYLKGNTLWVDLTDGLLKIQAKKFLLSRGTHGSVG